MVCEMFAGRFQGGGASKLCNWGGFDLRVEQLYKFGGGGGFSSKVSFCQVGVRRQDYLFFAKTLKLGYKLKNLQILG